MREQVVDGHRLPRVRAWRHVETDGVFEPDSPALAQLHDEHRGELFRDRSDPKLRRGRIRDVPFDVGIAVALGHERLALTGDQRGAAEAVHLHVRIQQFIHPAFECRAIERRRESREGGRRRLLAEVQRSRAHDNGRQHCRKQTGGHPMRDSHRHLSGGSSAPILSAPRSDRVSTLARLAAHRPPLPR